MSEVDKIVPSEKIKRVVDLQKEVFPDEKWYIDSILPAGLTMLIGRPKTGKSWMILQMCLAISSGSMFMDKFQTQKCPVLYISFEDWAGSLQRRVNSYGSEISEDFWYMTSWKIFNEKEKGFEILQSTVSDYGIGVVFIDTWQYVRPESSSKSAYEFNVHDLKRLREYARPNNVGLVLCHHEKKKGKDNDGSITGSALGSQAISGVPDNMIQVDRDEFEREGLLRTTGRVGEERQYLVLLDKGLWSYLGDGRLRKLTNRQRQVYEYLNGEGKSHGDITKGTKISGSTVTVCLQDLIKIGLLTEVDNLYYKI